MALEGKTKGGNGDEWMLRTGPETVYGQLSLAVLCTWAEQGRLTPDNEVSHNGRDWVRADTVPDLKMEWFVSLKSGANYGPVNLLSIPGLFRRGMISRAASLEHKITHRKVPAADLLKELAKPALVPMPPDALATAAGAEAAAPAGGGAVDVGEELRAARERVVALTTALYAVQADHARVASDASTTLQIKDRVMEEARRDAAQAVRERDAAVVALRQTELQLTRQLNDLESRLRGRQGEVDGERQARLTLEADIKALQERTGELGAQLAQGEQHLDSTRDALRAEQEKAAEARLRLETEAIEHQHREGLLCEQLRELEERAGPEQVRAAREHAAQLAATLEGARNAAADEQARLVAEHARHLQAVEARVDGAEAERRTLAEEHARAVVAWQQRLAALESEKAGAMAAAQRAEAERGAEAAGAMERLRIEAQRVATERDGLAEQLTWMKEQLVHNEAKVAGASTREAAMQKDMQRLEGEAARLKRDLEIVREEQQENTREWEARLAAMAPAAEAFQQARQAAEAEQARMAAALAGQLQAVKARVAGMDAEQQALAADGAKRLKALEAEQAATVAALQRDVAALDAKLRETEARGEAEGKRSAAEREDLARQLVEARTQAEGITQKLAVSAAREKELEEEAGRLQLDAQRLGQDQEKQGQEAGQYRKKAAGLEKGLERLRQELAQSEAKWEARLESETARQVKELAAVRKAAEADLARAAKESAKALELAQARHAREVNDGKDAAKILGELKAEREGLAEALAGQLQAVTARVAGMDAEHQALAADGAKRLKALEAEQAATVAALQRDAAALDAKLRETEARGRAEGKRLAAEREDLARQLAEARKQAAALEKELVGLRQEMAQSAAQWEQRLESETARQTEALAAVRKAAEAHLALAAGESAKAQSAAQAGHARLIHDVKDVAKALGEIKAERDGLAEALVGLKKQVVALEKEKSAAVAAMQRDVAALEAKLREREARGEAEGTRLAAEREDLARELAEARKQSDGVTQKLAAAVAREKQLEQEAGRLQQDAQRLQQEQGKQGQEAGQYRKQAAALEKELDGLRQELTRSAAQWEKQLESERKAAEAELARAVGESAKALEAARGGHARVVNDAKDATKALAALKAERDGLDKELAGLKKQVAGLENDKSAAVAALDVKLRETEAQGRAEGKRLAVEREDLARQLAEARKQSDGVTQKLAAAVAREKQLEQEAGRLQQDAQRLQQEQGKQGQEAGQYRKQAAALEKELDGLRQELARSAARWEKQLASERQVAEVELARAVGESAKALETVQAGHARVVSDVKEATKALGELKAERDALGEALAGVKQQVARRDEELAAAVRKAEDFQAETARLQAELQGLLKAGARGMEDAAKAGARAEALAEELAEVREELASSAVWREQVVRLEAEAQRQAADVETARRAVDAERARHQADRSQMVEALESGKAEAQTALARETARLEDSARAHDGVWEVERQKWAQAHASVMRELDVAREGLRQAAAQAEVSRERERLRAEVTESLQAELARLQREAVAWRQDQAEGQRRESDVRRVDAASTAAAKEFQGKFEEAERDGRSRKTELALVQAELVLARAALATGLAGVAGSVDADKPTRELRQRVMELTEQLLEKFVVDPGRVWRVKLDDGAVYGPVTLDDLHAWAADCRLGPGHQVAREGDWQAAESLRDLGMEWMVTLSDGGSYGPLNVFAIRHLMTDGVVARDAVIRHRADGRGGTWDEIATMVLKHEREVRAAAQHDAAERVARVRQALADLG